MDDLELHGTHICFLSTPSLYFSLKNPEILKNSRCFEFDTKFDTGYGGFVFYDFNHPENIPVENHHAFDMLVLDPPFITREVWEKYKVAIDMLIKPGGKILLSTVEDNKDFIFELT